MTKGGNKRQPNLEKFRFSKQTRITEDPISEMADQQPSQHPEEATVTLQDLAKMLNDGHRKLGDKLDEVVTSMARMQEKLEKTADRVTEVEHRMSQVEDDCSGHKRIIRDLQREVTQLQNDTDELENRARRNNIRVLGIPEKSESGKVEDFMLQLIRQVLPSDTISQGAIIDAAHRIPGREPIAGAFPRAMIVRMLHRQDRDNILQAARKAGTVKYGSATISFYPDFSRKVQKKRKSFDGVKAELRKLQIPYALVGKATLRVEVKGKRFYFEEPKEALHYVETLKGSKPGPSGL